ncbi:HAT repeat-containing protein [Tieghemostelium lacteum]|uniref:HAT repeat-containing protein n=1 Tax=Tieghemostelium lacteum TaxID=361077 RepID=A0A151ZA63_TIELA|nr:HAT repeat-containing protein [Tieghemostelium lacteum]|eukprot:KYQ90840.1 HAT repeat-containing protein [Tieghemostelium lacteum]
MDGNSSNRVKNKSAAPVQITAEQILRVALENQQTLKSGPKQRIDDLEELEDYRIRKRQSFEISIQGNKRVLAVYYKYADWEEGQKDFTRARSVYERCIDIDYRTPTTWIRYAEMEMRNKNINLARNIWDRAIGLLPRVSQIWFKYSFLEDMLGNYPAARAIFERWMKWHPEEQAWNAYVKFETRLKLFDNVRMVFERYIIVHPRIKVWIKYAKWEEKVGGDISQARTVYERAVKFFSEHSQIVQDQDDEVQLFITFAKFEERYKEIERARIIYKYALDNIPKHKAKDLFSTFSNFEKQHGDRVGIEDVIISKKRFQYEEDLKKNPKNYDTWFDYSKLEESNGDLSKIRDIYERSIAQVPPTNEKKHWKRYIYLWLNYAIFEELVAKDFDRSRLIYQACLKLIPHKQFSFSKIWIMAATFEIRQLQLDKARLIFGNAIGNHPKSKIFDKYIHLELELGNFDRARKLYEKCLELMPDSCVAWNEFAQLEARLGEKERSRTIYEIGVSQPTLDTPESLWKNYIDFEVQNKAYDNTRKLYRRLLERTNHVKVWISFTQFELKSNKTSDACRSIYMEAHKALQQSDKEERLLLLESWKQFEDTHGTKEQQELVSKRIPKRIVKRKIIKLPDGSDGPTEEYYEYIFPEEQASNPGLKLMEMALKWKRDGVNK